MHRSRHSLVIQYLDIWFCLLNWNWRHGQVADAWETRTIGTLSTWRVSFIPENWLRLERICHSLSKQSCPLMYDGVNTVGFFVDTCGYIIHCTVSHLSYYSTSKLVCLLVPGFRIHWFHFCRLEVASIVECMQRLSHGIAMWYTSSWTTGRHLKIWGLAIDQV